jgi:hypothetical protein
MTTSDADGNFKFQALPAGKYEMKVQKRGFDYLALPYALQKIEQLREWFSSNPNVL